MEELRTLLEELLNEQLLGIVISAPRQKESYRRIRIRALDCRGALRFQAAFWDGKKEFHKNYEKEALIPELMVWMSRDYRQLQAESTKYTASALVSKKGTVTVKKKVRAAEAKQADMTHNRTKQYLLPEGEPVPFLVKLGVMTPEGKVVKAKYDKFRQINRFLEFVQDILPKLPKGREINIIDFGCGKSYLTFAMYYYLKELKGYPVRIIGLDLKEEVIRHCGELAVRYGYDKLSFTCGDIASYEGVDHVDMVVTLHACDLATDYALEKAVGWGAKVILSVPCCQHELNKQLQNPVLQPVLEYGLIKERMAALYTDAIRAQILEYRGYNTQILEFIDMEHTPKNILLRAVFRKKNEMSQAEEEKRKKAGEQVKELIQFLHADPAIVRLLAPELNTTAK